MSAKKKHNTAAHYLRYLKGELSDRERHDLEQGMEADPFEMEAMEGLESLDSEQASDDLLSLHRQLSKRLARRRRIAFYSVAATIASLLIIGTVFLQIYDFNPDKRDVMAEGELPMLTEQDQGMEAPDVDTKEAFIPLEEKTATQEEKTIPELKTETAPAARAAKGVSSPSMPVEQPAAELTVESEEAEPQHDLLRTAPASTKQKRVNNTTNVVSGEYAAGARSVEYADDALLDTTLAESMAEPSIGFEAFEKYITEQIKYPDTQNISNREVVILNFTVTASGETTNFEAVRSPGEAFTDEAIRLVKEGPSWKPATDTLRTIEEVVRLRIVFKRE